MAKTEKELLREQLDKYVTYEGILLTNDKLEIVEFEIESMSFDALVQTRKNIRDRRQNKAHLQYRTTHNILPTDGSNPDIFIEPKEYIKEYQNKYPGTTLKDKELEVAALAEFIAEIDIIDATNKDDTAMLESTLSAETTALSACKATQLDIREKLANFKKSRKTATWR